MTITISNDSASVFARGYVHTENGLLVWLEIAPQHPKLTGTILATLVNGHRAYLQLKDSDKELGKVVYGLGHTHTRLERVNAIFTTQNDMDGFPAWLLDRGQPASQPLRSAYLV